MSAKFRKFMNPYGPGNKLASLAVIAMLGFFIGIMVQEKTFATAPLVMFCIFFALSSCACASGSIGFTRSGICCACACFSGVIFRIVVICWIST